MLKPLDTEEDLVPMRMQSPKEEGEGEDEVMAEGGVGLSEKEGTTTGGEGGTDDGIGRWRDGVAGVEDNVAFAGGEARAGE